MKTRNNNIFEIAVKKAIEMTKNNHRNSAAKMLIKTGVPSCVIERVIYGEQSYCISDID